MLAVLGFATVGLLLTAIMSGRMSPLVALIAVPTIAAVLAGMGGQIGPFVLSGLQQTAPVAAMFVFAILYFGVMTDAGLLDPIVNRILRGIGCRPRRVVMGAALLALLVHLDGSGAVTFLVTIPAILPLFERLRMDKRILACVTSMAAGVNFLPWTGPMLRASAALHISTADLFRPLIPVQIIGLVFVFGVAFMLGTREERRLDIARPRRSGVDGAAADTGTGADATPRSVLDQRGPDGRRDGDDDQRKGGPRRDVHDRHRGRAPHQLSLIGPSARPRQRARDGGVDDGGDPARRGSVHRDHEGIRNAGCHGGRGGPCGPRGRGAAPAVSARPAVHAPQSAVRSGLVLSRRAANRGAGWQHPWGAADSDRAGGAPGTDDDRVPDQPPDAGDLPCRGLDRHRARRPPAIYRSLPVRRICRHDNRMRCVRGVSVMKTVRIGSGAGYAGDRIEPAVELATHGSLDYLVFECLAERTIALAQEARAKDPSRGFDPMLERRLEAVLPACRERGVTIVTNMGAANPASAGECARELAQRLGCLGLTIATVSGDDVYDVVMAGDFTSPKQESRFRR